MRGRGLRGERAQSGWRGGCGEDRRAQHDQHRCQLRQRKPPDPTRHALSAEPPRTTTSICVHCGQPRPTPKTVPRWCANLRTGRRAGDPRCRSENNPLIGSSTLCRGRYRRCCQPPWWTLARRICRMEHESCGRAIGAPFHCKSMGIRRSTPGERRADHLRKIALRIPHVSGRVSCARSARSRGSRSGAGPCG